MEKLLLIVDDNKEIAEVMQEVLAELFDKIIYAPSVDSAKKRLDQFHFSYVILDINLEGRNGAEVVKYLVDHPDNPNNKTPFIIVSGIINPEFIARNSQKFSGILMKPFEHEELRQIIIKGLSGNTEPSAPPAPSPSLEEIPYLKCELPFPIVQLEQKVNKIMEQVKKNTKMKVIFTKMKIDRSDDFILTHIGLMINIATGISIQMEWNTDRTLEKFVYAAYLHNMALHNRPDLAKIKDKAQLESLKETLSPVDYKMVLEHPNIAGRTIDDIQDFPPDVGMIVRQHHELPKENGFPLGISFAKISPLSTIFIVAHDMAHYIMENEKWTLPDYISKAKIKFKGIHFQKVLSALSEIK